MLTLPSACHPIGRARPGIRTLNHFAFAFFASHICDVAKFLRNVGYHSVPGSHAFIDEAVALRALCDRYDRVWDGLCRAPREAPDRAKLATYFAWFDPGAWLVRPSYLFFDFSASATCTSLRFRLGSHRLQVELGRWQCCRPRSQRLVSDVPWVLSMMSITWCLNAPPLILSELLGRVCSQPL